MRLSSITQILFIISLSFYSCEKKAPQKNALKILPQEKILTLSKGWIIEQSHSQKGRYVFKKKNGTNIKNGEIFHLRFNKGKYLEYFELNSDSLSTLQFKLYVNDKLIGKYSSNKRIGTKRLVKSLRLFMVKTGNERVVKGWDRNFNYIYIKDTSHRINLQQQFTLKLLPENSSYLIPNIKGCKSYKEKTQKFINPDFTNNHNIIILKNTKTKETTEQSTNFKDDGCFNINYMKTFKSSKQLKTDYHLYGKWEVIKNIGSKTKIRLIGTFSGKLNKNSSYNTIPYKQDIIIDSLKFIRSKDFLDGIMLDLPNWVMVNLRNFNNDFIIDIPYSTENNIVQTKMYECNECYLLYTTVKDLLNVQDIFMQKGLRIKILDCYRPQYVQQILFDAFPVPGYVADPIGGSIHNRGTAVDLTMVDANGKELNMGTQYDDLSYKSNHGYIGFSDTILRNRALLRETMNANNFETIRLEWWHYNHKNARRYPKLNDKFPCNRK